MNEAFVFHPDRRFGLALHSAFILALAAVGVWGIFRIIRTEIGPTVILYLLAVLAALGLIPVLAYRAYSLYRAAYVLGREGMRLRWGLRIEDIPLDQVEWARPADELDFSIPKPRLYWTGSIVGKQALNDGRQVEFMASNAGQLILISTPAMIYAVSPEDPGEFLNLLTRFTELGSLAPLPARSVYPSLFAAVVWNAKPARYLILAGLVLSLILLAWASFVIPTRLTIPFGFRPDGAPSDLVPSGQLLLFPIANGTFFLADVILGLFLFRRGLEAADSSLPEKRAYLTMAYVLWGSAALTAGIFLGAIFFILQTG